MTVAALDIERPPFLVARDGEQLRTGEAGPPPVAQPRAGGEPTLDDLLVGAWEGLTAHRTVACPVCQGAMAPRYGAGPAPVGGRCRDCDSTLG